MVMHPSIRDLYCSSTIPTLCVCVLCVARAMVMHPSFRDLYCSSTIPTCVHVVCCQGLGDASFFQRPVL